MDMRATAPFEGWIHYSETPEPRQPDGLQGDGLDYYMDRRSRFTTTPAPDLVLDKLATVREESPMEE